MKDNSESKIWDVIIIGGGPAGMMAAGSAAENGKTVLLLEKNPSLGKKLLITGGGRCNLTNHKLDIKSLVNSYKGRPKALFSVFSQYDVTDTLEFFNSRGMNTKVEAEGRVFPTSDKAQSVWNVLLEYMKTNNVSIQTNNSVLNISKNKSLFEIKTPKGASFSRSCIVATGGTSHKETGSTGDSFDWLKVLGHSIIDNSLALVPISIKNKWAKKLSGLTMQDIKINLLLDGKRKESKIGKVLFTHFGLSGPSILNMSSTIRDLMKKGKVEIELDFFSDLDHGQLSHKILNILSKDNNKHIKNSLGKLLPASLIPTALNLANIDEDKPNHSITKIERMNLVKFLKSAKLDVKGLMGADKAIVSSGGVDIKEVNFKTMESKVVDGLFFVGDLLNIDRPSGGYSLQICWSTGYVAGKNAG